MLALNLDEIVQRLCTLQLSDQILNSNNVSAQIAAVGPQLGLSTAQTAALQSLATGDQINEADIRELLQRCSRSPSRMFFLFVFERH